MKSTLLSQIQAKKTLLDQSGILLSKQSSLTDWFKLELTYTSNAIEGNTLSRAQTAQVVTKNLAIAGKTLNEHQEAINHARAFDWVAKQAAQPHLAITHKIILDLHQMILKNIDDQNAGRYRNTPVRIAGSRVVLPNPAKVTALMDKFVMTLKNNSTDPVTLAIDAHLELVSIHPFVDGNGRTARLLMNLILLHAGYPPIIVHPEQRTVYLNALEKVQLGGKSDAYYNLMGKSLLNSIDLVLQTVADGEKIKKLKTKKMLTIGQLAKLAGEPIPTIRHWTTSGLLCATDYTPGGYQLFDQTQLERVEQIRKLQTTQRLSLTEIKAKLI